MVSHEASMREAANSHWLAEALAEERDEAPRLDGDTRADVCIVGGGFCGLWTAIHLKEAEPSLDVVVIEKDVCGAGASGRNGGFLMSWWSKFLTLEKLCGGEEAVRIAAASAETVDAIGAFCESEGIDCHYRKAGWLWAANSPHQLGAWDSTLDALEQRQQHVFRRWSAEEAAARSGSERHLGGVHEPSSASIQPARLARGLRRAALARGVRIHERTPLESLSRGARTGVVTPRGTVRASSVVLAMNAWGIRFAALRRGIVVVSSDIVASEPMPDTLAEIGWNDGMTISDGRMLVHYYRTTLDGRVVFGKGGMNGRLPYGGRVGRMFDGPSSLSRQVADWLDWTYPALGRTPIATSWAGPIDRSKSGLPAFGALEGWPRVFYGIGFSGNGVGPTHLGGRILSSLVLERDDEWARSALVRPLGRDFPPEPIRYVGGQLVRRAIARKDRLEDAGRPIGPITSALARFAPAGLSPFKGQRAGIG